MISHVPAGTQYFESDNPGLKARGYFQPHRWCFKIETGIRVIREIRG